MKLPVKTTLVGLATVIVMPALAQGSPWLPVPKTGTVNVTQASQDTNHFYRGEERRALPFMSLEQSTTWFHVTYGVADALAVDARIGRSKVEAGGPLGEEEGSTDMTLGATWRFADEDISEWGGPSAAVRFGIVRAGDYDVGMPHAIGDGGDGFEVSLLVGKILAEQLALAAELGQRSLNNDIPRQTLINLTAQWLTPVSGLSLRAQYHRQDSSGSLDIGGEGFAPARFPEVAEDISRISVGASYSIGAVSLGVDKFDTQDGRNTGDFDAWAATVTYYFDLFAP